MISKNLRTHIIVLRDGREINITQKQYHEIEFRQGTETRSSPLKITDADTKELLYHGILGEIKEFRERKQDKNIGGMRYICDYGTRHPLNEECFCMKKFNCFSFQLQDWLKKKGYKINYPSNITSYMQEEYIKNTPNN